MLKAFPSCCSRVTRRVARAFTLVEVLVVVAIVGIAGAVVVPQMLRSGTMQLQAGSRIIIADLLYAQNEAITRQSPRRVVFDTDNHSYKLTDTAGAALTVSWKNGADGNYTVDFKNDARFNRVQISAASFGGSKTVEFDALGAPSSGGTIDVSSGSLKYRITVAAFTGRVTIVPVP